MSESDGEVSTPDDGLMDPPRKTKKHKPRRKMTPAAVGEEHDDDGEYEPSIREEGPEYDDRMDNVPGHEEDGDDDDEPAPTADDDPEVEHDDPEVGQDDGDEMGVENGPHEEEDDEDDIDVGDPEGGVRLSKRGTLKHEARTL